MTLFNEIREIVSKQLYVDESGIKPESKLIDDLGADSLDLAELIFIMEEKFDIEIPDDDAKIILTVGDVVKAIEERTKNWK
ncbi:MAG: acyl carrier protein [Candidatus Aminicenantes bacterium]|nr:MAG: acyl carrier protein [Candidatus Aminicenantes bacterium]